MLKRAQYDLTHARHDPTHCLAPGLFRALKRGQRKTEKLDVVYEYGDGRRIEFAGPEPLGADDLRILQGLVAMAGPSGLVLAQEPTTSAGAQLRLGLDLKWDALQKDSLVVQGSYRALAHEIGYSHDGGAQFRTIRDCIERLWKVSIIMQSGRRRQGFRLLSHYASDEADGKLFVAVNPMIAGAVLGRSQFVRISMAEVRALQGDLTRLVHQRLCGWVDPGAGGRVGMDVLLGYAWPTPSTGSTLRMRRKRMREALAELRTLGWKITEYARHKWQIARPALDTPPPA